MSRCLNRTFRHGQADDEPGDASELTENQKDSIDRVLAHYSTHDAQWLSELTHMEDPWKRARVGIPRGQGCDQVITKESMAMYYGGL